MKSREEIYNKLIEINEHKDELTHFLNNPPNGGLWGISEKREEFRTQCSMIDLMEWVLDIKKQNKDDKEIYAMLKGEKVVIGSVNSKKQFTFREDIDMSIVSKKTMERLEDMYEIIKPKQR